MGGKQARPDGQYSLPVYSSSGRVMGQVGSGNRKDVRNAVEAAHGAAAGWGKRSAHDRSQILCVPSPSFGSVRFGSARVCFVCFVFFVGLRCVVCVAVSRSRPHRTHERAVAIG